MQRLEEHHAARVSLVVLALVVALGAAMCVRVHRALAHPDPAAAAGTTGPSRAPARRPDP